MVARHAMRAACDAAAAMPPLSAAAVITAAAAVVTTMRADPATRCLMLEPRPPCGSRIGTPTCFALLGQQRKDAWTVPADDGRADNYGRDVRPASRKSRHSGHRVTTRGHRLRAWLDGQDRPAGRHGSADRRGHGRRE